MARVFAPIATQALLFVSLALVADHTAARALQLDVGASTSRGVVRGNLAPGAIDLSRMLQEDELHGKYPRFVMYFEQSSRDLPWTGLWWRRVLDFGSSAKAFAVEFSGAVSACPAVSWALKASKKRVFNDHERLGRALKDVCFAHVFAGMPGVAPPALRVLDMRNREGHAFVLTERARRDLFAWTKRSASKWKRTDNTVIAAKLVLSHQVLEGVQRMHTLGLVHGDVKPENVMVEGLRAFLIDFEFVRRVGDKSGSHVGTMDFMSPRCLESLACGRENDIWAVGVTLYFLFFCDYPYQPKSSDGSVAPLGSPSQRFDRTIEEYLSLSADFAARMTRDGAWRYDFRHKVLGLFDEVAGQMDKADLGTTVLGMFRALFDEDAARRVQAFGGVVAEAARLAKAAAGALGEPWPAPAGSGAGGATAQCAKAVQQLAEGPPHPVLDIAAGIDGVQRCVEYTD